MPRAKVPNKSTADTAAIGDSVDLDAFSLTEGGPFNQALSRMRLAPSVESPPMRRIAAAILITLVPIFVLTVIQSLIEGGFAVVPLAYDFPVYVRFLVVIPLLVVAERSLESVSTPVLRHFVSSGLVREDDYPRLAKVTREIMRARRSPIPEVAIALLVVVGVVFLRMEYSRPQSTWQFHSVGGEMVRTWASWWYVFVSLPIFQFILLRWLWRYLIWCWFLWRVSRLNLRLMPSHPDRVGGLGVVSALHVKLAVFVFALELIPATLIAQEMMFAGAKIEDFQILIPAYVAIGLFIMLAPLFVFSGKLVAARRAGLLAYSALATEYTRQFDRKWIRGERTEEEPLLGNADMQSLADLGTSFDTVRNMNTVPFDIKVTVTTIAVATAAPFAPIALVALPLNELANKLIEFLL